MQGLGSVGTQLPWLTRASTYTHDRVGGASITHMMGGRCLLGLCDCCMGGATDHMTGGQSYHGPCGGQHCRQCWWVGSKVSIYMVSWN